MISEMIGTTTTRRLAGFAAKARFGFWLCCGVLSGLGGFAAQGQTPVPAPDAAPTAPEVAPAASPAPLEPSLPTSPDASLVQPDGAASPAPDSANEGNLFNGTPASDQSQTNAQRQRVTVVDESVQSTQSAVDQLTTTTFQRAQTNAEALYEGVGGVPLPLNPLYFNAANSKETGFIVGPLTFRPILSAGVSYQSISGDQTSGFSGFYGYLAPAVNATLGEPATGRTLTLNYGGNLSIGSDIGGRRAYSQTLNLQGTFNFTKLNLGFGLDLSQLSGSDVDFGGQGVERVIIGLSLTGSYVFSEKTSVSENLSVPIRLFGRGTDSEGVTTTTYLNYAYSPLTTVSVGVGFGVLQVEQAPDQTFEQLLTRFTYLATEKLNFNGTLGVEFRDAGDKEQINPIFGLGLAWLPREGTTLSLLAERRVLNSAAQAGANYTTSNFSLSLSQRIGVNLEATGTVGFQDAAYTSVENNVSVDREDRLLVLQGSLSLRITDRWIASTTISYAKNFSDNQFGIETFQSSLQLSYVF